MSRRSADFTCPVLAVLTLAACAGSGDEPEAGASQQGIAQISVSHITWGTIGLDSNTVDAGPDVFPVGVRIVNTGDATATNLTATLAFTTANANISLDGPAAVDIASLDPGAHADAYFNVRITRTIAAYNTSRELLVTVSGTGLATATTPAPREVYVERLVSQNRNSITGIAGPTTVTVGETQTYVLDAAAATAGSEQLEAYVTFPTSMFQVVSTATTYTAPAGATSDKLYADACGWDPVPTSPTYRTCIGPASFAGGKAGGTIHTSYTVRVIGAGMADVTAAVYDFSGASYHYNADFGALRIAVVSVSRPIAAGDSYTTAEDTRLVVGGSGVLANDSDPGGAALTAVLVAQPVHGSVTLGSNGSFVYAPDANYHGADSFTYKASNGTTESPTATASITITPVNDPPSAMNDTATLPEAASATAIDVLANDSDVDGDSLTIVSVTQPANGTMAITGGGTGLAFQPSVDFSGTTTSGYTISDGHGGTATATVTINVTPVGGPPDRDGDGVPALRVSGGGCQATGSRGAPGLVVLFAGLAAVLGHRRRAAAAIVLAGLAAPAVARADDLEPRNFSVERFQLAADRNGLFNVDGAEPSPAGALDAALVIGLVRDPLVVYKVENDERMVVGPLVETRTTADLVGAIALYPTLSIGADLPLVISQDRPAMNQIAPSGLEPLSSFGLGNLRVTPKLTLLTEGDNGVGLAVLAAVTLPTQSAGDAYLGDHGVSIAPTIALSRQLDRWRTGLNVGYLAREQARLLDLTVDDEVLARAGVGYQLPTTLPVGVDLTLSAATRVADFAGHVNVDHLETLLGATVAIDPQLQLFGGAGVGLAHGFGTPDSRFLLGLRLLRGGHEPRVLDRDHDGIPDATDRCPGQPEDRDGFEDGDGCPDPDNDNDGVLDGQDRCPVDPGLAELAGCPAQDSDADGIADHLDKCPTEPEDRDGFEDGDGCPDPDNDNDGVLDAADICPSENGTAANRGCPEPDSDGDTVVDRVDNCPSEKGPPENAGCPHHQLVRIADGTLDMIESVYFQPDRAIFERRSYAVLDNVAAVLAAHPALVIQVEGHTDSRGDAAYNLDLSQRRAQAVVDYLATRGVDRARLQPRGFGETKPIGDNRTSEGRAHNRRVVFTIVGAHGIDDRQGAGDATRDN